MVDAVTTRTKEWLACLPNFFCLCAADLQELLLLVLSMVVGDSVEGCLQVLEFPCILDIICELAMNSPSIKVT